ncbi:hypothetical protein CH333_10685 [candidate division WOR-3 bacterium JGI_Cruoil_03_44_89]|uniref:Outer membrane lipoprotein BamD-like domain-containing protein n=1 Tax=candidate division WOR-3 bacterium JGI_Cruoil_03_44_89 TaxID=1973748 RepID=A0A235BNL3_UNCW3|nr:MAG: hypothetical protein CH333_10685 [candidate division WOR-3 bacterium JGI_Cruoil_03_44_89]
MVGFIILMSLLTPPKECFDFAYGLYRDGVFTLARDEFANLVREYPKSPYGEKAEYYIASSDFYLENYELARDEFTKFISTHPSSKFKDAARQQLARCHFELREYEKSISIYKFLDTPDSKYWLGECYYREGELDSALYYYKTVPLESSYTEYAIYSAGFIERELGHYDEALLSFDRLIREYPESALLDAALYYAGRIYYENGDYDTAEERLTDVGGKYEEEASLFLGHTYLKLGSYKRAKEKYTSLLSGRYCNAGILGLGDVYYTIGELDKALAEYKKLEKNENLKNDVAMRIGRVYFEKKQYDEALLWFDKLSNKEAKLMASNTLYEMGRYDEARDRYLSLYKETDDEEGLYRASLSSCKGKNFGEAERLALEYLNRDYEKYGAHIHLILGEVYYEKGDYTKAVEEYGKACEDVATEREGLLGLSYAYEKNKDVKNAINTLTILVKRHPDNDILYKAAELAYSLKEYERAIAWYGRIEGADFDAGKVYFDMGRYGEAIESFRTFIKKFPMNKKAEEAQFLIGAAERRMGDFGSSIEALDDLLKLYPSSDYVYNARILIGDNCFDMGRYDDALVSYKKALSLLPQPVPTDAMLAINGIIDAEYRAGGLESALSLASSYVKTNPHISDEISIKAGDLAYQDGEYNRAAEYYNTVKSSKLMPRALYWRGMSYYSLGNDGRAEEAFTRLVREFPGKEVTTRALLVLSDIYIKKDDLKDAKECLIKANNDEALLKLAEVYGKEGNPGEAERILKKLIKDGNGKTGDRARIELARIYIESGDTRNARLNLSVVLDGNNAPLKPKARFLEGESYRKDGDYKSASRSYLMVNYLYGENEFISKALFNAAECQMSLEKSNEARKFYMMVIERGDDSLLVKDAKNKLEEIK